MQALLAGWRVSLRRTRADWPIVAAAWLITLLAATLLAGGAIYPSAAAEAGLRSALGDAAPADAVVEVSHYGAALPANDELVRAQLEEVLGPIGGEVVRDWRTSATLALPKPADAEEGQPADQAVLGFLDGLPAHTTLIAGAWPADGEPASGEPADGAPTGPIDVAILDAIATELGLQVGDDLTVTANPSTSATPIPLRVAAVYSIKTPSDPFWLGDTQLTAGIREIRGYRLFGPFMASTNAMAAPALGSLDQHWRTFLDTDRMAVDQAGPLRGRIGALENRLDAGGSGDFEVSSALPDILEGVERSLLVSRTGVLLLVAQLAILAAYAIVLTASLLVDHRRVDTALLRSRGAGPWQVAGIAFLEGLLLAVPAVVVAPWLAAAALNVLNDAGPLAEVGLRIEPRVGVDAYVAAAAAGAACVVLLVLPAFLAARSFTAEHGEAGRQETRTFGQRMGIDLALLVVTGIALWQLRLYGAPLTKTVQGSLGIDPLLVAAPAIGMLAGGVVALRLLPLLAQAVERTVTRGRELMVSLGSRQLARRPLRYTRSALLLMLAMSMGVFALSYGATWATSQRDQAEYQAGADLRVAPDTSDNGPPAWSLPAAYRGLDGLAAAMPVERQSGRIDFLAAGSADLMAIDADSAGSIVRFRQDQASAPFEDLLATLRAGRPEPALEQLPAGARDLNVRVLASLEEVQRFRLTQMTGELAYEPLRPEDVRGIRVRVNAVVRDADGLLYARQSELLPYDPSSLTLIVPLMPNASGQQQDAGRMVEPLTLASIGLELWLPDQVFLSRGRLGITTAQAGPGPDGPWSDVALADGQWRGMMAPLLRTPLDLPDDVVDGTTVRFTGQGQFGGIFGGGNEPSARVLFMPRSLLPTAEPIPVLANRAFLEATSSALGEELSATIERGFRRLRIVGVVDTFPTTDPAKALLLFDEPTLGLLRLRSTGAARAPDEWWMRANDGAGEALAATLRSEPFASTRVISLVERTRSLSTDPVALGIIGALTLGFVITGLFAVVGLTVSGAVSARQRRTEFALLRALGLSGRQLFGSLWLENGSIVLVSLLAGTALGLVIGWTVLPFVTVTQQASAPVPPVLVEVPWGSVAGLEIVSALALGVAVLVIGGALRRLRVGSVLRMGED